MLTRHLHLHHATRALRLCIARSLRRIASPDPRAGAPEPVTTDSVYESLLRVRRFGTVVAVVALGGILLAHPPVARVQAGELGLRTNQLTGGTAQWREGTIFAVPALHQVQVVSLRDRSYQPGEISRADARAPLQSADGLAFGIDLVVRYALDPERATTTLRTLPGDPGELVAPAVQAVVYKVFARYTVREAFAGRRAEIQGALEHELRARLAAEGLLLRGVVLGRVDLPPDYRREDADAALVDEARPAAGPPQGGTAPSGGSEPREAGSVGATLAAAGPPQGGTAPSGGSEPREAGSVGPLLMQRQAGDWIGPLQRGGEPGWTRLTAIQR